MHCCNPKRKRNTHRGRLIVTDAQMRGFDGYHCSVSSAVERAIVSRTMTLLAQRRPPLFPNDEG